MHSGGNESPYPPSFSFSLQRCFWWCNGSLFSFPIYQSTRMTFFPHVFSLSFKDSSRRTILVNFWLIAPGEKMEYKFSKLFFGELEDFPK